MSPNRTNPKEDLKSLVEELERAQERSRHLEPNQAEYTRWTRGLEAGLGEFLARLSHQKTYHKPEVSHLTRWSRQLDGVSDPVEIFNHLIEGLTHQGLLTAGPGHLGYIPGGGLPLAGLGDWLSATVNPFCGDALASPVAALVHQECLQTLQTWVGFDPDTAGGDITSGGSHATLLALKTARERMGVKGRNYHRTVVYLGEHTHHCARKSLDMVFGDEIVIRVISSNNHGQMDSVQLATQIAHDRELGLMPFLVVATAGSTNLGSVDSLREISHVAKLSHLWFHVDAAYGGFFTLCPSAQHLFEGLSEADSIVLDPHKGLFLPYGIGAVLFKTRLGGSSKPSKTEGADYLQDRHLVHELNPLEEDHDPGEEHHHSEGLPPSPMDSSFELTRPFRSLRLWLALKAYGKETFAAALEEKLLLARYARLKLGAIPSLDLYDGGDLSIVAFRVRKEGLSDAQTDELTEELLKSLLRDGSIFVTSTMVQKKKVIRLAILSFRTHRCDIDFTLQLIDKHLNQIVEKSHVRT